MSGSGFQESTLAVEVRSRTSGFPQLYLLFHGIEGGFQRLLILPLVSCKDKCLPHTFSMTVLFVEPKRKASNEGSYSPAKPALARVWKPAVGSEKHHGEH